MERLPKEKPIFHAEPNFLFSGTKTGTGKCINIVGNQKTKEVNNHDKGRNS